MREVCAKRTMRSRLAAGTVGGAGGAGRPCSNKAGSAGSHSRGSVCATNHPHSDPGRWGMLSCRPGKAQALGGLWS